VAWSRNRLAKNLAGLMLVIPVVLHAQTEAAHPPDPPRPHTSTLPGLKTDRSKLKQILEQAKAEALHQLQALGGTAAIKGSKLASLSAPRFFEQLAVRPPVGPSTIAAPKLGAPVPYPSVNNVGANGGTTAGDPGVVLMLARLADDDVYTAYCSGTLVRQNVILSAAHCVCFSDDPPSNYPTGKYCLAGNQLTARAPLLDPSRWRVFFPYAGVRTVRDVVINDQYNFDKTAVRADMALFVLSRAVGEINPPTMPPASDATPAWPGGSIVGYGLSANPNKPATSLLQELVLPGLKAHGKVELVSCSTQGYLVPKASLCAVFLGPSGQSQSTVCKGDSGGPLWLTDQSETDIGITSGRNDDNCAASNSLGFEMSTTYPPYWNWINSHLAPYSVPATKGRWPTFGQNLRFVLDRRNFGVFDQNGHYESDAWLTTTDANPILGTMNSTGAITHFELQTRDGKTLCTGLAGGTKKLPNVDYCSASIPTGLQFRVVARGDATEFLQYVVTSHAPGTSFAE
jgi:hypothetical protein